MNIYQKEAERITPMYCIGFEDEEERRMLTSIIAESLKWGGNFMVSKIAIKSYFSPYSLQTNIIIVSNVMDISIIDIITGESMESVVARRIYAYISHKNHALEDIAEYIHRARPTMYHMINIIDTMIKIQDIRTLFYLQKVLENIDLLKQERCTNHKGT